MVNYRENRTDLGYLPSEGETLAGYVARLKAIHQQNRHAYSPPHEKWYTHYGSKPCWICNFMDISDYIIAILEDIGNLDKKNHWKCIRPSKSYDSLTFTFKPFPKK